MTSSPPTESLDAAAPAADAPVAPLTAADALRVAVEAPAADTVVAESSAPEADGSAPEAPTAEVAAGDTPADGDTPTPTAPRAPAAAPHADFGPLLKKTFPALFSGAPKPLKLRIQTDIQERAPGVFTKQALSAFFRRYTGSTSYLLAVSRAQHRFDLDGAPAGELSQEHRQIALDEIARRRGNQQSRIAEEQSRLALEEQKRRNRATLLHDFERTTLTPANFCALKGIGVDELDGYLATARREAAERPLPPPAFGRDGPRGAPDRPHDRQNDRPNDRPRNGPPNGGPPRGRPQTDSRPASRRR